MAEYKRKRRRGLKPAPKVNKKRIRREKEFEDIKMTPSSKSSGHSKEKNETSQKKMRVLSGKKIKLQRRMKATAFTVGIIAVILAVCQFIMPAGVFETLSNNLALIGSGGYPISLESSETVNLISHSSYYYLLTNNSVEAYSSSGKRIFSYEHGFENPVLKTSSTRALVFEQNGTRCLLFTLKGLKQTLETEQSIKNAAIGDDGSYALVLSSKSYAAQVSVYKKNGDLVYEWFSSKDLVNNVALAPSGKKMAVSTITSNVGTYNSKLSVLNFESSSPEYEKSYEDTVVYAIDSSFASGFSVITANEYNFIKWSNFKISEYKNEYNTQALRVGNNGIAVLYNRENDKTDNRIAIFTKNGKLKREIKFKGLINDFALKNHHIYCVSDTKAYILDNDGEYMRSGECGFGVVRICPLGQNAMAIVTDNQIDKIKLE